MANDAYLLQGQNGGIALAGTDSWTAEEGKPGRMISFITDTVFSALESNIVDADSKLIGGTFVAGHALGGQTTSLTLQSGAIVVYF